MHFVYGQSQIELKSTLDNTGTGPRMTFFRNSASPADDDVLGRLIFKGNTSSSTAVYADIIGQIIESTEGQSDGALVFRCSVNGTDNDEIMRVESGTSSNRQVIPGADNETRLGKDGQAWSKIYNREYWTHDGSSYVQGQGALAEGISGTLGGQSHTFAFQWDNGILSQVQAMQGSDEGIKTDIADVGTGLSLIDKLKPKTFKFKDDFRAAHNLTGESYTQYGFIAQDLQAISSDYVRTIPDPRDENETILAIDAKFDNDLKASMIKAIQELSAKNDALEARKAALEG